MKKTSILFIIILSVLILGAGVFYGIFAKGSFEYTTNALSKSKAIKSDSGRTNFLIIGLDTRDSKYLQTGTLTDTLIVASVNFINKDVKLLSIPRDLWINESEFSLKVNEIYAIRGYEDLQSTIEETLNIKIHYNVLVSFTAFEKLIDIVGGVDVNNPYPFTDYFYPKFGWENETCGIDIEKLKKEKEEKEEQITENDFPCRYETISYKQGVINLSGIEALKYARSRHSGDTNQGTDFARAKRQHLVMIALKDKLLSSNTYSNPTKLKDLYFIFQDLIKTNLANEEFLLFLPKVSEFNDFKIRSVVLSDSATYEEGGVLIRGDPNLYGGRYVLIPKRADSIKSFSTSYFYANNEE